MNRASFLTLLLIVLLCTAATAQDSKILGFDQSTSGGNVVQAPEQLRRVPPPPIGASVAQLEDQADQLRVQKDYADALDYYRAAMKKQDTAVLENKAGIAELQLMHMEEARQRFEKAVKLDREYADARNNLGVTYYVKRNYKKAIKAYEEAIKANPESSSFHSNLASAYFAKKEYDKASAEYMIAMQIDPDIFERQSSGGISAKLGSPEDRAKFHFTIAKVFAQRGDADNCLLYLRKAMEEGFPTIEDVYKEAEFSKVIKDPRFVTLMASKPQAVK